MASNKKKNSERTVLQKIDLSKAFDMVSHDKLIKDLLTTLPSSTKRWLSAYLHGRQSKVNFRNKMSTSRNVRTGVPQGAVTSPVLFNVYLSKLPSPPPGVKLIQYADDISIYATGVSIDALTEKIHQFVKAIAAFLDLESSKSPQPNLDVGLDKTPKILGVTLDTIHFFSHHIDITTTKK